MIESEQLYLIFKKEVFMKKLFITLFLISIASFALINILKADCTAECTTTMGCTKLLSCHCYNMPDFVRNCSCSTTGCSAVCYHERYDEWEHCWVEVTEVRNCSDGGGGGTVPKVPQ